MTIKQATPFVGPVALDLDTSPAQVDAPSVGPVALDLDTSPAQVDAPAEVVGA
jgi:hypothetical protein